MPHKSIPMPCPQILTFSVDPAMYITPDTNNDSVSAQNNKGGGTQSGGMLKTTVKLRKKSPNYNSSSESKIDV